MRLRRTLLLALAAAVPAALLAASPGHAAAATFPVAPYVYTGDGTDLAALADQSGQNRFTVAFVLAGNGCQAAWNGGTAVAPGDPVSQHIAALRSAGGDVSVSLGGAAGTYLDETCTDADSLAAQYEAIVDATGVSQLDLDLEQGLGDQDRQHRIAQAVATMQGHEADAGHPVAVTYTLGVGTDGLPGDQLGVVQDAVDAGVDVAAVNIMTMDYGPGNTGDMGDYAVSAATAAEGQLEGVLGGDAWGKLGITPMIGPNDTPGETFTTDDAQQVVDLANQHHVAMLAFWEMGNDNSGYTGQPDWSYTHLFAAYTG